MVKKVLFFGASVVLAFIVTFVPTKIKAADTPATGSVTVVPPRFELFGNPGEDVPNQASWWIWKILRLLERTETSI